MYGVPLFFCVPSVVLAGRWCSFGFCGVGIYFLVLFLYPFVFVYFSLMRMQRPPWNGMLRLKQKLYEKQWSSF